MSAGQPAAASRWSSTEAVPAKSLPFLSNAHFAHSTGSGCRAFVALVGSGSIWWFGGPLGPSRSMSSQISCPFAADCPLTRSSIWRQFRFVKIVFSHFVAFADCCTVQKNTLGM